MTLRSAHRLQQNGVEATSLRHRRQHKERSNNVAELHFFLAQVLSVCLLNRTDSVPLFFRAKLFPIRRAYSVNFPLILPILN